MKRLVSVSLPFAVLLCLVAAVHAQPVIKCGADLVMHQSMVYLNPNITCTVTFDVIQETPTNIRIQLSDSTPGSGLLVEQTRTNLSRLTYTRDTFGVRLVFHYMVDDKVSTHYWRMPSPDTVLIVTPSVAPKVRDCYTETRSLDVEKKEVTLEGNVFTYDNATAPARISVERVFDPTGEHTLVMENNYPQLDGDIRMASGMYDLARFQGAIGAADSTALKGYRLFIRFHVIHLHKDSRKYEVL
ncbi:MAG: hypothetical protein JST22_17420 [Bacteroidetes bacterium]|nr:hypothetical protein [Bacteroidota bacterium]